MTQTKTKETVRTRVESVCNSYIAQYEKALAKFNEDVAQNPLYAIEWQTSNLAETVEAYIEATRIKEAFTSDPEDVTVENVTAYIARERKHFDSVRVARSTNPIANEIENLRMESRVKMLFSRYGFFCEIEDAINERH